MKDKQYADVLSEDYSYDETSEFIKSFLQTEDEENYKEWVTFWKNIAPHPSIPKIVEQETSTSSEDSFDLLLEGQILVEEFGDFNALKECLDYLRQRVKDLTYHLEKALKYSENGCSDEDKWSLEQDIKEVLEAKNEIFEK